MADNIDFNILRARAIQLVDSEDRPRVQIREDDGGKFSLSFFDLNGQVRMSVGLGTDNQASIVLGLEESPRMWIKVDNRGSAIIGGFDNGGKNCFQLDIAEDEGKRLKHRAGLRFFGQDGNPRVYIGTWNNEPRIEIIDSDGIFQQGYRDEERTG